MRRWISAVIGTAALMATPTTAEERRMTALGDEALQAVKAFFDYDPSVPLQARVVERRDREGTRRDKVVFRGVRGFRVPGYLELPGSDGGPFPCVLLLHGWSSSKDTWYKDNNYHSGGNLRRALLEAGVATFALDAQIHGDRIAENDYSVTNIWSGEGDVPQKNYFTLSEICEQTVRDYRRGLDYLATRPEIDVERIGALGYSMGAWQMYPLAATEPRVKVCVAAALPTQQQRFDPVAPQNYVAGISQPFLMLLGRDDTMATREGAEQLLALLPSGAKQLLWYDSGHKLPVAYVPDAVAWLVTHLQ